MPTTPVPTRPQLTSAPEPVSPPPVAPAPVVAALPARKRPPLAGSTPAAPRAVSAAVAVPRPPHAFTSAAALMTWLGSAAAAEPLSLTVSAVTRDIHVTVPDAEAFRQWCVFLSIPPRAAARATTVLGSLAEASVTAHGWTLHVRLFGAAAEELLS